MPQRSRQARRRTGRRRARYWALPVPTSFQFGSREVMSRANVQTSVISATFSGVAVDNRAGLVAGDRDHLRHEANGQLRGAVAGFRTHQLGLVDRNESRFRLLLVLLAILDHGLETLIDLGRQQILQRAAVAIGEGQHDHLVGALRAAEEMPGIERGILGGNGVEAQRQRRARLGQILPAVGRGRRHPRSAPAAPDRSPCPGSAPRYCPALRCSTLRAARSKGGRSFPVRCPRTLRRRRKMKTASARKMMV